MKRKRIKLISLLLTVTILFCSCGTKENNTTETDSSVPVLTQTPTPAPQMDIPNEQQLIQCYTDALAKLTDSSIVSSTYENYEPDSDGSFVDIILNMSDNRTLNVSVMYLSNTQEWNMVLIQNRDNSHLYYIPYNMKEKYDLYDYNTDEKVLEDESVENNTFKYKARLTHGYYYSGINIPCGSYDAKWISGTGMISFEDEPGFGIQLGKGKDYVKKYKNIDLADFASYIEIDGDLVIEISCNAAFVPIEKYENKNAKQITLDSGTYEAGIDFNPGIYDIKCLKGSGNIQTDGEINDIMATKSEWSYFSYQSKKLKHIMIREGEKLKLKSIKVKMTPSKLEYEKNLAK